MLLLAAADRAAAATAERLLADELQRSAGLDSRPQVEVHGTPFLTQVLAGRYDRIDVVARDVPAGALDGTPVVLPRLAATLRGVHLPVAEALSGGAAAVPVDRVDARALLPFDVLTRSSQVADLAVAPEGERLRLTGTVRVLGQDVSGSASSALSVDDGQVVVTAESFDVGGRLVSRLVTRALAGRFDARLSLGTLPYGLQVDGVQVRPDGLAVTAAAEDAVLAPPPA